MRKAIILGCVLGIATSISDMFMLLTMNAGFSAMLVEAARFPSVIMNSFTLWFTIPVVAGFFWAKSKSQGMAIGVTLLLCANTLYYLYGHTLGGRGEFESSAVQAFFTWSMIAAGTGLVTGLIGNLARRTPLLLLAVTCVAVGEIIQRGGLHFVFDEAWASSLGTWTILGFALISTAIIYIVNSKHNHHGHLKQRLGIE